MKWDLYVTSLDKIRQSIDEVVAQVLLSQAEQLRNEVSDRIRPFLDEDAKHQQDIEEQLRQRLEQAQALEQQLAQTRGEITEKQQRIDTFEERLRSVAAESGQIQEQSRKREEELRGRVGELENTLKVETERIRKQSQELEQLLDMSQDEVKQLQAREQEQKNRLQEVEKTLEDLRVQMQDELSKKDDAHKTVLSSKDQEHIAKVRELEEKIETVRREATASLKGKEQELLDQVHLLEELLVQGQQAREQQLDAKDRELHGALDSQKTAYEARVAELQAQLNDRDKVFAAQGGELQQRVATLETELATSQKQFTDVQAELAAAQKQQVSAQSELQDTQAAFEKTQQQLDELSASSKKREEELANQLKDRKEAVFTTERSLKDEFEKQLKEREETLRREFEVQQSAWKKREEELVGGHATLAAQKSDLGAMQGAWEQREKELTAQLGGLEKRLTEYSTAEQAWQKREQELLGHRDQVLSSSAEASEVGQKALQGALEDQARLQTQLDAMIDELGRVRDELQQAQAALANQGATAPQAANALQDEPSAIKNAIEQIHAAHSQTEILKALLEHASHFAGRAGIMVVHGHTATGWGARGFGAEADFRRLNVECSSGLAARMGQERTAVSGKASDFDSKLVKNYGAPADGQATLFPLLVRDRVVAFLYADCGSHAPHVVSNSAIGAVVNAAGAWLEELAKNKKSTAPTSHDNAPPTPVASAAAVAEVPPAMSMAAVASAGAGTSVKHETPANNADVARQRARRFAKLLVDEIKLYNKDAVEVGRRNSDLYDRLREAIDKSRASYEKRWGKTITDVDYFREELVRNLAENDVAVLGANFPR